MINEKTSENQRINRGLKYSGREYIGLNKGIFTPPEKPTNTPLKSTVTKSLLYLW